MTAGITIFNDYGNVQIDSDSPNLMAYNIFRTDSGARPPYTSSPNQEMPTWSKATAFAISPNPDQGFAFPYRSDDPNQTYRFAQAGALIFEFTENTTDYGERTGLELYDASGKLTYSSTAKYMNVIDYVKVNDIRNGFSKNYGTTNIAVVPTVLPITATASQGDSSAYISGAVFSLTSSGLLTMKRELMFGYSLFYVADWKASINAAQIVEFLVIDTSIYY